MLVAMTILRTPDGGWLKALRWSAGDTEECSGTIHRLILLLAVAVKELLNAFLPHEGIPLAIASRQPDQLELVI